MGDHRFSFKAEFEFHGIKDTIDLGWHNWDGGTSAIDSRILRFIESVRDRGFAKYETDLARYFDEQNKSKTEESERAELARLKLKYEK